MIIEIDMTVRNLKKPREVESGDLIRIYRNNKPVVRRVLSKEEISEKTMCIHVEDVDTNERDKYRVRIHGYVEMAD